MEISIKDINSICLQPCTIKEYKKLLLFLDRAFEKPQRFWFPKHYGHIFIDSEQSVCHHYLFKDNNKITGVIGIYPFKLKIGSATLTVGGIGSVSVAAELRNKGIMSTMLKQAITIMEDNKFDISWLGGDRHRYRNYGWDFGGKKIVYTICCKDIARYGNSSMVSHIVVADKKHIPVLSRLYSKYSSRVPRSAATWEIHLSRDNLIWLISESKNGSAYLLHFKGEPNSIQEMQADSEEAAISLLLTHAKRNHLEKISVVHSETSDLTSRILIKFASDYHTTHCSQIRLINVDSAWKKLLSELKRKNCSLTTFDSICSEEDKRVLLLRGLGCFDWWPPMTKRLQDFKNLKPLSWWISAADCV